jgi:hypothetical protein
MFPALPPRARWAAALIAALSAVSVVGIYAYNLDTGRYATPSEAIWELARFFTILTHVLATLTFGAAALRRDGVGAPWLAALTLAVILVGAVYHTLLRGITVFEGYGLWADHGLHTVVPVACALWWIAYAPKQTLAYADLPMFVVWPVVYVAYSLARAARDGVYPYPFMDIAEIGAGAVVTNLSGLLLLLFLGGLIFVMIGRFADR